MSPVGFEPTTVRLKVQRVAVGVVGFTRFYWDLYLGPSRSESGLALRKVDDKVDSSAHASP